MENKVTYLIGAGASANALPVQVDISGAIEIFIKQIAGNKLFYFSSDEASLAAKLPKQKVLMEELVSDLNWLKHETSINGSVDTYAKQLHLRKEFELLKKTKECILDIFCFPSSQSNGG